MVKHDLTGVKSLLDGYRLAQDTRLCETGTDNEDKGKIK